MLGRGSGCFGSGGGFAGTAGASAGGGLRSWAWLGCRVRVRLQIVVRSRMSSCHARYVAATASQMITVHSPLQWLWARRVSSSAWSVG